jgi:hypothetical protein
MFACEARVPTMKARKYAAQLSKHWAHNLVVSEEGDTRSIVFPRDARGAAWAGDATLILESEGDVLVCRIEASEAGQRDVLKDAVVKHVERFAFREAPLTFEWRDW